MPLDFHVQKTTGNVVFDLNILVTGEQGDLVCEQNHSLFSWVKRFGYPLREQKQQHMTYVPNYTLCITK